MRKPSDTIFKDLECYFGSGSSETSADELLYASIFLSTAAPKRLSLIDRSPSPSRRRPSTSCLPRCVGLALYWRDRETNHSLADRMFAGHSWSSPLVTPGTNQVITTVFVRLTRTARLDKLGLEQVQSGPINSISSLLRWTRHLPWSRDTNVTKKCPSLREESAMSIEDRAQEMHKRGQDGCPFFNLLLCLLQGSIWTHSSQMDWRNSLFMVLSRPSKCYIHRKW